MAAAQPVPGIGNGVVSPLPNPKTAVRFISVELNYWVFMPLILLLLYRIESLTLDYTFTYISLYSWFTDCCFIVQELLLLL